MSGRGRVRVRRRRGSLRRLFVGRGAWVGWGGLVVVTVAGLRVRRIKEEREGRYLD
jgi:hypothetical protein